MAARKALAQGGRARNRGNRRDRKGQLALFAEGWGGRRQRAGRKRGAAGSFGHAKRPWHSERHPVHVVMKARYRSLRTQFVFPTVRRALAEATRRRADFRIIQFSVQGDHLHLIVEASDRVALSRGMQGLAIRIARQVNRLVSRTGKLWAERYFARDLTSPRATRNAFAYVLNNFRKHRPQRSSRIDPYSSAPYFTGFSELRGAAPIAAAPCPELRLTPHGVPPPDRLEGPPILRARTWLAKSGWHRAGAIAFHSIVHSLQSTPL